VQRSLVGVYPDEFAAEDRELARAMAASLADGTRGNAANAVPSRAVLSRQADVPIDDDDALALAVAASLQDQ
jgi:hypothetical protein